MQRNIIREILLILSPLFVLAANGMKFCRHLAFYSESAINIIGKIKHYQNPNDAADYLLNNTSVRLKSSKN